MIVAYWPMLANHLWQSTVFAVAAALLTLAFRKNSATVRYAIWLAASIKFLIPFALLINLGAAFEWKSAPVTAQPFPTFSMEQIAQPFTPAATASQPARVPAPNYIPIALAGLWLAGFTVSIFRWTREWHRMRTIVRAASPLNLDTPIPTKSTAARLEPGVFGIRKPVLLLPAGITDRLTSPQFQAIVAHELCHVRRRDNLAAAIHMLVAAIFWFHPLVWWIGTRLVEERERACDEHVLRIAAQPEVYAEGILRVCRYYLEAPQACVSGVTGANLKKRIQQIMTPGIAHNLSLGKRILLTGTAVLVTATPIVFGILNSSETRAQSVPTPSIAFEAASVKPNNSTEMRGMGWRFLPGGRFKATNLPLYAIISVAYDLPFQSVRLSGGPNWIRSEKFDIEATAGSGALPAGLSVKSRQDKARLMLQALLADRFKLSLRRETRQVPAFVVIVAKNGPKLQKSKIEEKDCTETAMPDGSPPCYVINGGMGRGLHAKAVTVSDIVSFVENWSDRPIVDKTGIQGLFEVETDGFAPLRPRPVAPGAEPTAEDLAVADPARPTVFMIFDRLGLKMEAQRAPVDVLVIEHVEKPSSN